MLLEPTRHERGDEGGDAPRDVRPLTGAGAGPSPTGSVSVTAGETGGFQGWCRDANPTITWNASDAVSVQLQ